MVDIVDILSPVNNRINLTPKVSDSNAVETILNETITKVIENHIKPIEYHYDLHGRYYRTEQTNQKIYKQSSFSSEYELVDENDTGEKTSAINGNVFRKLTEGRQLYMDGIGDYFMDELKTKYYVRKYEKDEKTGERYYLNEDQKRVFKADPYASEYLLLNDKMERIKIHDRIPYKKSYSTLENEKTQNFLENQRQQDLEYIKEHLGKPLRIVLASVVARRPSNPINYLANALLHYRYTELLNKKHEREMEELINERNKIQEEIEDEHNLETYRINSSNECDPCKNNKNKSNI